MGYYWGWFISPNIGYYWLCHEKHVAHFELHISYFWQFHLPFHFHRLSLKERLQLNIYLTSRRNISFPFSLFHWQLHFWCLLGRVKHFHFCRISWLAPTCPNVAILYNTVQPCSYQQPSFKRYHYAAYAQLHPHTSPSIVREYPGSTTRVAAYWVR